MNARFLSVGLAWLLAASAAAAKPAAQAAVAEGCSGTFRVCVVDEARTSETAAERAVLRTQLVASLQETIGAARGRVMQEETVAAKVAAQRMKAGECDAVIYLGQKRPRKLRRLDVVTFAVDLGAKRQFASVYLIVPAREVQLRETILAGFGKSLAPLQPPTVLWAAR